MSRNLYKLIQRLEDRVEELEKRNRFLENQVDHLETLMRLKDKIPERPFFPNTPLPESPWYKAYPPVWMDNNDSITKCPKITAKYEELEDDPFIKLMKETFDL